MYSGLWENDTNFIRAQDLSYILNKTEAQHKWQQLMTKQIHTRTFLFLLTQLKKKNCSLQFPRISSVQFSSFPQSCPTLCDPMNCSTPSPVHHQLPEFTQTHVHRVGDAIQPSHPLSSPSPPAPNPSQHQSLFQ